MIDDKTSRSVFGCHMLLWTVIRLKGQSHLAKSKSSLKFAVYYGPQAKFAKVMFLHVSVCPQGGGGSTWAATPLGTRYAPQAGTPPQTRYTPWDQVHRPRPGTPPGTRYTPRTRYTLRTRYTPWTRYTTLDQVHPPGPDTPPDQVHPPDQYTQRDQVHPPEQVHPQTRYTPWNRYTPRISACWEIRAISGWYASYWNAFLFFYLFCLFFDLCLKSVRSLLSSIGFVIYVWVLKIL